MDIFQTSVKSRFEAAVKDHNFTQRSTALGNIGRDIRTSGLSLGQRIELLNSLAPPDSASFVEHARLLVARHAKCMSFAKQLLGHRSQSLRQAALMSGLLTSEDAREAFLSSGSSMQLKSWLVHCSSLPCDAEVLEHAEHLFTPAVVWQLLRRAQDEGLLQTWLEKLAGRFKRTGLTQLVRRFPDVIAGFLKHGKNVTISWRELQVLVQLRPEIVLRGLKESLYLCNDRRLATWGWRHQPDVMFGICRDTAPYVGESNRWNPFALAKLLMGIPKRRSKSSKWYLTPTVKITWLVTIVTELPEALRTANIILSFVQLFPSEMKEHRSKYIQTFVGAFWKIVAEMGRARRKDLLAGNEMAIFRTFAGKLPAALAVEQFFQALEEFEADAAVYKFFQSDMCKTSDGRHDALMLRVFERYLHKEGEFAIDMVTMFQVLLADVIVMDVLQTAFDTLILCLGKRTELGLLYSVVSRMKELAAAAASPSQPRPPRGTLPIPVNWLEFVDLSDRTVGPHATFLHLVLHSGTEPTELLGAMLAKFGPSFFWDTFEHVLLQAGASGQVPLQAAPRPNVHVFQGLDVAGLAKALLVRTAPGNPSTESAKPCYSLYFDKSEAVKQDTYAKCNFKRENSYATLCELAHKDEAASKAFDDLLPFLVLRLANEQPNIRNAICLKLLGGDADPALPHKLWPEKLEHLKSLWKVASKPRIRGTGWQETWRDVGKALIEHELHDWAVDAPPSEACLFGLEMLQVSQSCADPNASKVNLAASFVSCDQQKRKQRSEGLSDAAARWAFEAAVPLPGPGMDQQTALQAFWSALETMSTVVPTGGRGQRHLWARWPFLGERWGALLAPGGIARVTHLAANFVLVDVVELMIGLQSVVAIKTQHESQEPWWVPLECDAYARALANVLSQIEAGDIPAPEASRMLSSRVKALVAKAMMTKDCLVHRPATNPCFEWVARRGKWYQLEVVPRKLNIFSDDGVALPEMATLSKVLAAGSGRRHVLWEVVETASILTGVAVSTVLEESITLLDARLEGMARCVELQYPYLRAALSKGGSTNVSCDVLTPLMELWLNDPGTRNARCAQLMQREDFECFLCFGNKFSEHLSFHRQEWLHQCFLKLQPVEDGEPAEFYHYTDLVPSPARVAVLGPGWQYGNSHDPQCKEPKGIRTNMWHPDTQTEFLQKALASTTLGCLAIIPRLEYADGVKRAGELLNRYPKEQTGPTQDTSTWAVIQPSGSYRDLALEIQRRFRELAPPGVHNAVLHPEVEQLLLGLGHADDARSALKVVAQYTGDIKRAKDAVVTALRNLTLSEAREMIRDVMFGPKAGVSLQIAALRLIADLQIPGPLELYRTAWRGGECHRDVAAVILGKVATSPPTDWQPEDVRDFFRFLDMPEREDVHLHVAELLLEQLIASPRWWLPFLPEVVLKLVVLPGATYNAVAALKAATEFATEVVGALTQVVKEARLAVRAQSVAQQSDCGSEAVAIRELAGYYLHSFSFSTILDAVKEKQLEQCDAGVLLGFVRQVLQRREDLPVLENRSSNRPDEWTSATTSALEIWARLLRPGEASAAWADVLASMQAEVARHERMDDFDILANVVSSRIVRLQLGLEERSRMNAEACSLFERLLDNHLRVDTLDAGSSADLAYRKKCDEMQRVAERLVLFHWSQMLSYGCSEADAGRLFARCPSGKRAELASALVGAALEAGASDVARRALAWLLTPVEARDRHWATVLQLWPRVAALETEEAGFERALGLLGGGAAPPPAPPRECCVALVEALLKLAPAKGLIRRALGWLSRESAQDAARLWPALLTAPRAARNDAEPGDIKTLLSLCEAAGIEPPHMPLTACSGEVLGMLVASSLPSARVMAVQALQERQDALDAMDIAWLEQLCGDSCVVVRQVARHLRALRQAKEASKEAAKQAHPEIES